MEFFNSAIWCFLVRFACHLITVRWNPSLLLDACELSIIRNHVLGCSYFFCVGAKYLFSPHCIWCLPKFSDLSFISVTNIKADIWYSRLKIMIKYFVDYFPAFTPRSAFMYKTQLYPWKPVDQNEYMSFWI